MLTEPQTEISITHAGTKERLVAILKTIIQESSFGGPYKTIIANLAMGFLNSVPEADVVDMLEKARNEIIPWLLGENH